VALGYGLLLHIQIRECGNTGTVLYVPFGDNTNRVRQLLRTVRICIKYTDPEGIFATKRAKANHLISNESLKTRCQSFVEYVYLHATMTITIYSRKERDDHSTRTNDRMNNPKRIGTCGNDPNIQFVRMMKLLFHHVTFR
jgi:hypothetical protein